MNQAHPPSHGAHRWAGIAAALVAPLLLLGAAWLAVDRLILAPPVPGPEAQAAEVVGFVAHARGLPRLDRQQAVEFLQAQAGRLAREAEFRSAVLAALNRSPAEARAAFEGNLIDVLKPLVMADVYRYKGTPPERQRDFLDDRIVAYNSTAGAYQSAFNKELPTDGLFSRERLMRLLLSKTTEQERNDALVFGQAYGARVEAIVADPTLKRDFEQRIAETIAAGTRPSGGGQGDAP